LIAAGLVYLIYYGVWLLAHSWQGAPQVRVAEDPVALAGRRRRWQEAARETLRNRAPSEKMAELIGSLLMSALVVSVLTIVTSLVAGGHFRNEVSLMAYFAWFAITATLGIWALLFTGKAYETHSGTSVRRRFTMLVLGLVLGAVAFGLAQLLMLPLRDVMDFPHLTRVHRAREVYDSARQPLLPAYLAYFAGVFVAMRWWRLADPLRPARFSLWATGVCVLWAAVLELFWHFPQPWGLMLVATIAIGTQLSAPWIGARERSQLRQQVAVAAR
jgi:hypothetical protein